MTSNSPLPPMTSPGAPQNPIHAAARDLNLKAPPIVFPELPEEKSFAERLDSLAAFDCFRISRILETAEYATLYACLCLPLGVGIDLLCKRLYPRVEEDEKLQGKKLWWTLGVAVLQVVVSAISIIYIRKLADLVPFFMNLCPSKYVPHYHVEEVFGETAIAMIFVGVQVNLLDQLARIRKAFG